MRFSNGQIVEYIVRYQILQAEKIIEHYVKNTTY